MDTLTKDFVHALRALRKTPTFSLTAILTIALGLGASATIFSVVNAVLLKPLPYRDGGRLVYIWSDLRNRNVADFPWAPGDVWDTQQRATMFDGVAGVFTGRTFMRAEGMEPEQVVIANGTTNMLRVLGARVALGRDFQDSDAALPPPPPPVEPGAVAPPPPPPLPVTAIITDGLWKRRYGGDPSIVGQTVPLGNGNGRAHIIGVLEPGVELLFPAGVAVERQPDIFTVPRFDFAGANRNNVSLRVFARLKDGATIEQAQTEVDQIAAELRDRFPTKKTAGLYFRVEAMHPGLVADVQPAIIALMGAVTFVLLVACANVANLLLVRAGAREREFAVRAALGGSRRRLVRQILVESLVLALAGAIVGLVLAEGGVRLLLAIGPEELPRLDTVAVDWNVALFAGGAAIVAALLFGAVPAIRASRPGLMDVLRASGRTTGGGTRWLRDGVVLAEVALSFVLLIGSGLMIRSFIALQTTRPGYDYENVLTFFAPSGRPRQPVEARVFLDQVTERLKSTPGVVDVTGSSSVPLDGFNAFARWGTEDAIADPSKFQQMTAHFIRDNYFNVMKTPLLEGRAFTRDDHGEDIRRIIIDSVIAKKAFPGQSAVGRRLLARVNSDEALWYDVVGVSQHQRRINLAEDGAGSIFFPEGHIGPGAAARWVLRTSTDPMSVVPAIRGELAKLDPTIALSQVESLPFLVNQATAPTRFALVLIGVFAGVAVLLASIGLYGVLAGVVRQKTGEIGVRIAFGAPTATIFREFIGRGLKLAGIGVIAGGLAALGFTRWMSSMLVGVTPTDPATYASIAVLFIAIAALACWIPARRAARLSPVVALRQD
jgi:putative ABC transport system permease protein